MTVRIIQRGFTVSRFGAWLIGLGFCVAVWWVFAAAMGLIP